MDDIEMLLPGLKVSSRLIRQRPVRSHRDDVTPGRTSCLAVGCKRQREGINGGESENEDEGAAALRHCRCTVGVRRLRLSPSPLRSPAFQDDVGPTFHVQAGITSSMLHHLHGSLDAVPVLHGVPLLYGVQQSDKFPEYINLGNPAPGMEDASLYQKSKSVPTRTNPCCGPCPSCGSPPRDTALSVSLAAPPTVTASAAESAPSTPLPHLRAEGEGFSMQSPGLPTTAPAAGAAERPKSPILVRAEKWHERICLATTRLKARSSTTPPPRTSPAPCVVAK